MLTQISPMLILVVAAALIFVGGRLARRAGLSEAAGYGVVLCIIAVALALSPTTWRIQFAGADVEDRLLNYATLVGLTGLLFLAGTSFHGEGSYKGEFVSFGIFGALLFAITTLLLAGLIGQPTGIAVLVAATVVAASLWFPAQFPISPEGKDAGSRNTRPAPVTLTGVAMVGLYFGDVVTAIPNASRSTSVYLIVIAYEVVKLAVLFAFAYFIASRFLARASGRVSLVRTNVGFILISILLFALISLTAGQLGAMAWAFIAGALWQRTNPGKQFSNHPRPFASALLLSLAFLSLPLQSHGRSFTPVSIFWLIPIVAIAVKLFFAWVVVKREGMTTGQTRTLMASIAFPGEMAILFLSFSLDKWFVDGPVFFGILMFAFGSCLLVPLAHRQDARNVTKVTTWVLGRGLK